MFSGNCQSPSVSHLRSSIETLSIPDLDFQRGGRETCGASSRSISPELRRTLRGCWRSRAFETESVVSIGARLARTRGFSGGYRARESADAANERARLKFPFAAPGSNGGTLAPTIHRALRSHLPALIIRRRRRPRHDEAFISKPLVPRVDLDGTPERCRPVRYGRHAGGS